MFRRYFNLSSTILMIFLGFFGLNLFGADLFFARMSFLSTFENVFNQTLQFIFKLDMNWIFLFSLVLFFLALCGSTLSFISFLCFIFVFYTWQYTYVYNMYSAVDLFRVNEKLVNGFFMIHPLLTYVFYSGVLGYSALYLFFLQKHLKHDLYLFFLQKFCHNFLLHLLMRRYLYIGLTALVLGGWWAQQEINWNGWWGWDFVELANLSIFIYFILLYHNLRLNFFNFFYKKSAVILVALCLFYSVLLRYGIFNSLHTFLGVGLTLQIYYYLFILIFLGFIYIFIHFFKYAYSTKSSFIFIKVPHSLIKGLNMALFTVLLFSFYFFESFTALRELFFIVLLFYVLLFVELLILPFFVFFFSFYTFFCLTAIMLVLFYSFYRSSRIFHVSVYCYILLFVFYSVDADYFLWLHNSSFSYYASAKLSSLYSFYCGVFSSRVCSNYLNSAVFYLDITDTFFSEHKLFFRNSLYIAINSLVQNNFFFDFFEFKLLFRFVFFLYGLISVYFTYLFGLFCLKRKGKFVVV